MAAKTTATRTATRALAAKRVLNKRAAIPTSKLPAGQRKERLRLQKNKRLDANPLYDGSQNLTGHVLANTVTQLANNEYDPQISDVKRQIAGAGRNYDTLASNTRNVMSDTATHDTAAQNRSAALAAMLKTDQQGVSDRANTATAASTAQGDKTIAAGNEVRGLSAAPSNTSAGLTTRQATQNAAHETQSLGDENNFQGLIGAMAQARQAAGAQTQANQGVSRANEIDKLGKGVGGLSDLAAKKAASKTDMTLKLRDQAFTNQLAASQLGVKDAAIKAGDVKSRRSAATSRANTKSNNATSTANNAATNATSAANNAATNAGKPGKSGFVSTADQGKKADVINSALGFARSLKGQKLSRQDAAQRLMSGAKESTAPRYDPKTGKRMLNKDGTQVTQVSGRDIPSFSSNTLAASVALDIAYDGHISAANVERLHAAGIKVNALGYPTKAQPKTKPKIKLPGGALGPIIQATG